MHVGDALEPDLRERRDGGGIEPQRREGEGDENVSLVSGRNKAVVTSP